MFNYKIHLQNCLYTVYSLEKKLFTPEKPINENFHSSKFFIFYQIQYQQKLHTRRQFTHKNPIYTLILA
jgi:hypothetical protein